MERDFIKSRWSGWYLDTFLYIITVLYVFQNQLLFPHDLNLESLTIYFRNVMRQCNLFQAWTWRHGMQRLLKMISRTTSIFKDVILAPILQILILFDTQPFVNIKGLDWEKYGWVVCRKQVPFIYALPVWWKF